MYFFFSGRALLILAIFAVGLFFWIFGAAVTFLLYLPLVLALLFLIGHLFAWAFQTALLDCFALFSLIPFYVWYDSVPDKNLRSILVLAALCALPCVLVVVLSRRADGRHISAQLLLSVPLILLALYGSAVALGGILTDGCNDARTRTRSFQVTTDNVPIYDKAHNVIATCHTGDILTAHPALDGGKYAAHQKGNVSVTGDIYGVQLPDGTKGQLYSYLDEIRTVKIHETETYHDYDWCPEALQALCIHIYQHLNLPQALLAA